MKTHRATTAALFLLALAARLAWGLLAHIPPAWDGVLYERGARALATGLGYSCFLFGPAADPAVPTAFYPVGYPAFLGALYRLFGVSPAVIVVSGALVGALTVALAHRLALRCGPPLAAHLAALLFALAPGQVIFATTPMSETLWGALLVAAALVVARTPSPRTRDLLGLGALLAAAIYVRPQALPLAALLPLLFAGTLSQRLRRAAIVTATVAALIAPWSLRNCRSLDGCALVSTNGGSNFAIGSVPRATGLYFVLTRADGCGGVYGERARDLCWQGVARASVRANPRRWLDLMWPKLYFTYANETFPVDYLREARPELLTTPQHDALCDWMTRTWWPFWMLALLGAAPLPWRAPLSLGGRAAVVTVLAMTLTHLVVFGGDRYHLPWAGLLVALMAAGFRRWSLHAR